jgi:hypothetical protein
VFALRRKSLAAVSAPAHADPRAAPARPPSASPTASSSAALEVLGGPDAEMPRWRRPSLMAARRSAPGSAEAMASERITFERGVVRPDAGREVRTIRYRMVRVADRPDQLLSAELGWLDQDDEVELIEPWGAYWRIRTPLGLEGWVHRTTLGEPVRPVGGRPTG